MSVFRPHITRWTLDGKRVPANTPGATKVQARARKWYGKLPGKKKLVPLSRNKTVAMAMYTDLIRKQERRKAGLHTDPDDWSTVPLSEQLEEFRASVAAGRKGRKPPKPGVVRRLAYRIGQVLVGTQAAFPRDLDAVRVQQYLATLSQDRRPEVPDRDSFSRSEVAALLGVTPSTVTSRAQRMRLPRSVRGVATRYPRSTVVALAQCRRGMGQTTVAAYARAVRRFSRWLTRRGRLAADPLADLDVACPAHDGLHQRRPLSPDETLRFLAAVAASGRRFRRLSGADRHALYLTALSTGFRVEEVATLTPERFRLDETPAVVLLGEAETKNDRGAVQPLPSAVVPPLREYLRGKPPGVPAWPGTWPRSAALMIRRDLEDAGIPYVVPSPDGPLHLDFHATRHSFVAMLKRAGVNLSQAMRLARHSDPRLTMRVYGREDVRELADAVDRIGVVAPLVAPRFDRESEGVIGSEGECEGESGTRKPRKGKGKGPKRRKR